MANRRFEPNTFGSYFLLRSTTGPQHLKFSTLILNTVLTGIQCIFFPARKYPAALPRFGRHVDYKEKNECHLSSGYYWVLFSKKDAVNKSYKCNINSAYFVIFCYYYRALFSRKAQSKLLINSI